jgi:mono/diheme cytochrome c family protein
MRRRLLGGFLLLSGPALAQAPAALSGEGRRLAKQWCANCHAVAPDNRPPAWDAVPSLPSVAARPSTTQMSLRAFPQTPHASMPDHQLSRAQTDAAVAYILSLRR